MNEFKNYSFSLPPLAEQEAIAAYLDKECEKIGREIELLERKADSYRRLRRAIINQAVTRGLNPNVPMKPSGLRWVPNIPEHWNVGRVRNYFNFRNEKVSEIDSPPLSVTKNGVVPQMENVAKSMAEGDTRKKVCKNDFVVNSRSDRKGSCGTSPLDGSVSLIYIVLEPTHIDPAFANSIVTEKELSQTFGLQIILLCGILKLLFPKFQSKTKLPPTSTTNAARLMLS